MKPTWFDWCVYRIFYWRWNPILRSNPRLRTFLREYINQWEAEFGKDVFERKEAK